MTLAAPLTQGMGMVSADLNGKSDPYLKFLIDGVEVGRTIVRKFTLEPKWQTQTFVDLEVCRRCIWSVEGGGWKVGE